MSILNVVEYLILAQEFDAQLKKMMEGDVTLVDSLGAVKLAIQVRNKVDLDTNFYHLL